MPESGEPAGSYGSSGPGWYPDPWGRSAWRWWDGRSWTGWISPPETVGPAVVRQLVVEPAPATPAPPEAPARERLAGGAPAGIGPVEAPRQPAGQGRPGQVASPGQESGPAQPASPGSPGSPGAPGSPGQAWGRPPPAPGARLWDGRTGAISAPAVAEPARPVARSMRRRVTIEILVVLAVFPLPYSIAAVQDLVGYLLGEGPGNRIPILFPGHDGAALPFVVLEVLLPLAAAAVVLYLLSFGDLDAPPGARGGRAAGPAAIGLDRSQLRGDLALVLPVFAFCNLIPIVGGGVVLHALGVHSPNPSTSGLPSYYGIAYVAMAIVAGIVEEIVVLGYLVRRLEQLGMRPLWVVVIAVAVRGSYHLYYGWGVVPILAWATVSVVLYRRYRRLGPFIVVHMLWDTGLFLAGHVLTAEILVLTPLTIAFTAMWWRLVPVPAARIPGGSTGAWSDR